MLGVSLALPRPGWIGAALSLLALLYFGHLLVGGEFSPGGAGLVGVALLLVGELGSWSADARLAGRYEPAVHLGRAVGIAWLGLLGLGIVVLAWLATGLAIPGGVATAAVAMAAAVALLGLISLAATRLAGAAGPRPRG